MGDIFAEVRNTKRGGQNLRLQERDEKVDYTRTRKIEAREVSYLLREKRIDDGIDSHEDIDSADQILNDAS